MSLLSVDDYKQMLNKLAVLAFVTGCVCMTILRHEVPEIDMVATKADFDLPANLAEWMGIPPLPLGTVAVGLFAGILSHAFKLHDKLASLLRLRHDFDVRWILLPMAALSGVQITSEKLDKFAPQRHRLMKEVFYRYASSSAGRQIIDPHIITQALTNWSWYWFCLESFVFLALTASVLMFFCRWQASTWVLLLCLVLVVAMRLLRADSSKSAIAQVEEILSDSIRRAEVKATFDAL